MSNIKDEIAKFNKEIVGIKSDDIKITINYMKKKHNCVDCFSTFYPFYFSSLRSKHKASWSLKGNKAFLISWSDINSVLSKYDNNFHWAGIYNTWKFEKKLKKNISGHNRLGLIIYVNDEKYMHWVGMIIDESDIYYFDSDANQDIISNYIEKFVNVIKSIRKINNFYYNLIDIQRDNINCGYFAIDFIISVTSGTITYDSWIKQYSSSLRTMGTQKYKRNLMNLRKKYFNF